MQKYYLIILLTFPLLLSAENYQSINDSQDWQFALTSGDTVTALEILLSSSDTSDIRIALDFLLISYEKDSLSEKIIYGLIWMKYQMTLRY